MSTTRLDPRLGVGHPLDNDSTLATDRAGQVEISANIEFGTVLEKNVARVDQGAVNKMLSRTQNRLAWTEASMAGISKRASTLAPALLLRWSNWTRPTRCREPRLGANWCAIGSPPGWPRPTGRPSKNRTGLSASAPPVGPAAKDRTDLQDDVELSDVRWRRARRPRRRLALGLRGSGGDPPGGWRLADGKMILVQLPTLIYLVEINAGSAAVGVVQVLGLPADLLRGERRDQHQAVV